MKPPVSTAVSAFFNYAGKLLLTVIVVFIFLFTLQLVMKIHALFLASRSHTAPSIYTGHPAPAVSHDSVKHPFWPEYPRNTPGNIQSAVINGVQILTEEWEAGASALEILAYYREQMIARGWRDVTVETYKLQPELLEVVNGSQDERHVNNYRNIMDSTLVLSDGEWSMHITAEPSKKDVQKTAVKIYAAATPSIKNCFAGLGAALVGNRGPADSPLVAEQQNGKEHYHTTIVAKNETPAQAFQEALAKVGAEGWQPVLFLPKSRTQSGFFAWLVKGRQYAALSVSLLPQSQGSSVTLTEVSPK